MLHLIAELKEEFCGKGKEKQEATTTTTTGTGTGSNTIHGTSTS
jgi:hypothetical protein